MTLNNWHNQLNVLTMDIKETGQVRKRRFIDYAQMMYCDGFQMVKKLLVGILIGNNTKRYQIVQA
jgi:hypothetical protein